MDPLSFIQSLNLSQPNWDTFIVLLFIIGALLYGLSLGRDRVIVILVSVYMALAVVANAPVLRDLNLLQLSVNDNFVVKIGFFLGMFVLLFFLLSRSALLHTIAASNAPGSWWQTIVFSVLQVGLLISITLSFLPPEATTALSIQTQQIFLSYWGKSAWMVLPVVFMAIAPQGGRGRSGDMY
ncbi:MAG: hypothetical protein RL141_604 [Candidatus Parcubacteria bacterium]|jgi:hypothetical protein